MLSKYKKYIIWGAVILFVLIIYTNLTSSYNSIVMMDVGVTASWAQVENV